MYLCFHLDAVFDALLICSWCIDDLIDICFWHGFYYSYTTTNSGHNIGTNTTTNSATLLHHHQYRGQKSLAATTGQ